MQFNTYIYIFAYLPATVILYYLIAKLSKVAARVFLVAASFLFYLYGGSSGFLWLIVSVVVNYCVILILRKKHQKGFLWAGILFDIVLLFYFKYANFTMDIISNITNREYSPLKLILPIGISFFTFQQISYLVDAFHKKTEDNSFLDYLLYVTFFPKILMGPITKQEDLIPQFHDEKNYRLQSENIMIGIRKFNIGLFKKVIIADTFARVVNWAWGLDDFTGATSMDLILVMVAYTFEIYFDFSGYSDMAEGSALLLNIKLPMNFDSPYKALSIRDFWKRWHISLTRFLTEYVYIPLGGSRKGKARTIQNTLIVFLVSGIWHGANWTYILWGLLHGAFSIFDRFSEKWKQHIPKIINWILTFSVINILWLLFRSSSISEWGMILKRIFSFESLSLSDGLIKCFDTPESKVVLSVLHLWRLYQSIRGFLPLVLFPAVLILCLCFSNTDRREYKCSLLSLLASVFLLVISVTCIGSESIFIYANF